MTADDDPRCDFCERRFIRIKNGVAVCEKHLGPTPDSGNLRCGICGGPHDAYSALCPPYLDCGCAERCYLCLRWRQPR